MATGAGVGSVAGASVWTMAGAGVGSVIGAVCGTAPAVGVTPWSPAVVQAADLPLLLEGDGAGGPGFFCLLLGTVSPLLYF